MTAFDGQSDKLYVYFDGDGRDIHFAVQGDPVMSPEEAFEVAVDLLTAVQVRGRDDLVESLVLTQSISRGIA